MYKNSLLIFLSAVLVLSSCSEKSVFVESPDENIRMQLTISKEKQLQYHVVFLDSVVILESDMGFELTGGKVLGQNLEFGHIEYSTVDETWEPVYGERSEYRDNFEQAEVEIINLESGDVELSIIMRAYNEGIAFRYLFPTEEEITIVKENTQFSVPDEASFWVSSRAQSMITRQKLGEIADICDRPVLAKINSHVFMAIGEAALVDFARMKLMPDPSGKHALTAALDGEVVVPEDRISPWRFVMLAKDPAQILENNFMVLNLNEPNKIEDTSWIRPGKIIREVTLSTKGGIACIDFAFKHGLQFIEFDAGWYGNQYDEVTDATSITLDPLYSKGSLDLQKVIDYGKEKGIGVILYVNRRAMETQLNKILPLYKTWGVAGVKYGFVNVGEQEWTSLLHEVVRKTAEFQIMVDIHDEYRPTGYSRTYPNLMTTEGIRGDEESPTNDMVINTLFTRMIAGAGDQTNCYFAFRVEEKMGSHASQMAKSICVYSPWQFLYWYDRPEGSPGKMGEEEFTGSFENSIPEIQDLDFFAGLPTVWDDTKILGGYPGEFALIARRSGKSWYIGALNGLEEKQFTIKLDFLEQDQPYKAEIYTDNKSLRTRTNVEKQEILVDKNSIISRNVLENNGMAVVISPAEQ